MTFSEYYRKNVSTRGIICNHLILLFICCLMTDKWHDSGVLFYLPFNHIVYSWNKIFWAWHFWGHDMYLLISVTTLAVRCNKQLILLPWYSFFWERTNKWLLFRISSILEKENIGQISYLSCKLQSLKFGRDTSEIAIQKLALT